MTELKVVELVPQDEIDKEKIGKVIDNLHERWVAGEVHSLLYLTFDAKRQPTFHISPNMLLSEIALALQYLDSELKVLLLANGDRGPPEIIA